MSARLLVPTRAWRGQQVKGRRKRRNCGCRSDCFGSTIDQRPKMLSIAVFLSRNRHLSTSILYIPIMALPWSLEILDAEGPSWLPPFLNGQFH
eukprot:scaffold204582_cov18-Prasinocladus_malaysianus.AAC.2